MGRKIGVKCLFETFDRRFSTNRRYGAKRALERECVRRLQQLPISQDFDFRLFFRHAKNQPMDERAGSSNFILNGHD